MGPMSTDEDQTQRVLSCIHSARLERSRLHIQPDTSAQPDEQEFFKKYFHQLMHLQAGDINWIPAKRGHSCSLPHILMK